MHHLGPLRLHHAAAVMIRTLTLLPAARIQKADWARMTRYQREARAAQDMQASFLFSAHCRSNILHCSIYLPSADSSEVSMDAAREAAAARGNCAAPAGQKHQEAR